MSALTAGAGLLTWRVRLAFVTIVLLVAWASLAALGTRTSVDLVLVLLPLLLLTFLVGAVAGALLGVVTALAFVLLVNWYLVPPVHTLAIESTQSQVALLVFVLAAVLAALMTDRIVSARTQAELQLTQRTLIADVVEGSTAAQALERFAAAFALSAAALYRRSNDDAGSGGSYVEVLAYGSPDAREQTGKSIDVLVMDDYRLCGFGPERMGIDRGFAESMASAVVRAFEGEHLALAQEDSARLLELDRSRSALLASVGHDLRTPLSTIRLSTETLQQDVDALSAQDVQELLSVIADSGQQLEGLITNLLDLSRIESGAVISSPVELDLDSAVAEAIAEVDDPALQFRPAETAVYAYCDPALLSRVLVNLMANAVMHRGNQTPIEVSTRMREQDALVLVADHGVGIPEQLWTRAIKPFQQVGTRADGGAGAGLAIADAFCTSMGGELVLSATESGGLTVTVRLPASPVR